MYEIFVYLWDLREYKVSMIEWIIFISHTLVFILTRKKWSKHIRHLSFFHIKLFSTCIVLHILCPIVWTKIHSCRIFIVQIVLKIWTKNDNREVVKFRTLIPYILLLYNVEKKTLRISMDGIFINYIDFFFLITDIRLIIVKYSLWFDEKTCPASVPIFHCMFLSFTSYCSDFLFIFYNDKASSPINSKQDYQCCTQNW